MRHYFHYIAGMVFFLCFASTLICFNSNHNGNITTEKKWQWWEQHRVLPFCMIEFTLTRKHAVFWHNMLLWETRNFIIAEQKCPTWGAQKTWLEIWKTVFGKSLLKVPFYSPSIQDVCIVFAYLWEMGVTVIKLTGSQFCRVWIMKSHKMWKSKDIFLKISVSLVAELMNFDFSMIMNTCIWWLLSKDGWVVAVTVARC